MARDRVLPLVLVVLAAVSSSSSSAGCLYASDDDRGPSSPSPRPSSDPPPAGSVEALVTKTSPSSGPWGTVYTIEGRHLDRGTRTLTFATAAGGEIRVPSSSPLVVSWSASRIEVRVPFPADGEVLLDDAPAGAFASTFGVGKKGLAHGGADPTGVIATRSGELVVAGTRLPAGGGTREAFLYRVSADDAVEIPAAFLRTALLRDESGPFAVLEDSALAHSLLPLDPPDPSPTPSPAPIADLPAERIIGSGVDATGPHVWTVASGVLTRHRLASGAWTAYRTVSGAFGTARALASAEDGTVTFFGTTQAGGTFDDYDNVHVQYAGPAGAALGASVLVSGNMDDTTNRYRVWAKDSLAVSLRFCATDEKAQEFDGRPCFYWSSTASGSGWGRVDFLQYDGSGADAATASCKGGFLVVEDGGVETKVLSPCRNVAAFTRDTDGRPLFLVAHETQYLLVYVKP